MIEQDYWKNLDVNYGYIIENYEEHYKKKLETSLKNLDSTDLFDICEKLKIFNTHQIKNNVKKEYIGLILKSNYAQSLCLLFDFYKYKVDIVNDHFERLHTAKKVFFNTQRNTFIKLFEIFNFDKNELKNLLIFNYWYRNATFSHKFTPSIPLRQEFITDFENKIDDFNRALKKHKWKNLSFKYFGKISLDKKTIYSITRQTGDKLIRNIDQNKRNKVASDLLLSFDIFKNSLEIRCRDKNLIPKTIKILEKLIRLYFERTNIMLSSFDNKKFTTSLENEIKSNLNIIGISFIESNLEGGVPLAIPPFYNGISITKSIIDLKNRKIIELNIDKINSIILRYEGKIREIELRHDGKFCVFSLKKRTSLNDKEIYNLSQEFTNYFGVGLDEKFNLKGEKLAPESIIKFILSQEEIEEPDMDTKTMIIKLKNSNLIDTKEENIYQCKMCRKTNPSEVVCPDCLSKSTNKIKTFTRIKINRDDIVNFIIKKINNTKIKVVDKKAIRTWSKKYLFLKLEYESINIFIFISFGYISSQLASFFQRAALPILSINVGKSLDDETLSLANFDFINIEDLYLGKISEKELSKRILNNITKNNSRIVGAATDSDKKLHHLKNYNENYFEDDIFNILKFLFRNVEKWGKERRGRELPEGLGEIEFISFNGNNKRSFSWDCKYTYNLFYNLDINEKRKAESYIRILNKSKEVKRISGHISSYILISNSFKDNQLLSFTEYITKKIRAWKGVIIFIELKEILRLYELINTNYQKILDNHNEFKKRLSDLLLEKTSQRYKKITLQNIEQIFVDL